MSAQESRDGSYKIRLLAFALGVAWDLHAALRETRQTYFFKAEMRQLCLEMVHGMEDGWVLAQKVAERLCECFGLAGSDLAQSAFLVGEMPVHLADLVIGQTSNAARASSVLPDIATVHVSE